MKKNLNSFAAVAALSFAAAGSMVSFSANAAAGYDHAGAYGDPIVVAQADCRHCGTVVSVQTVQREERAQGIAGTQVTPGMAIGGVVGGLLGNQVGHGNGRAVATVAGAAGGAYVGNKIEKGKRYTAYVMRIRMNDGSTRTVEQRTAYSRGTHVAVEGNSLRRVDGNRG